MEDQNKLTNMVVEIVGAFVSKNSISAGAKTYHGSGGIVSLRAA